MKNIKRIISLCLALIISLSLTTTAIAADRFSDVNSSAWYYNDVMECAAMGIVEGDNGLFSPENHVTGVQFIAMLTRTFYADELAEITTPSGQPWYYPNITVAGDLNISDNTLTFQDAAINRNDMARALYNILVKKDKTATNYGDAASSIKDYTSIPANRRVAVCQCYTLGILTGMDDGTFSGDSNMTRAQACTVIMRMLKLINNYNPGDLDNDEYDDGKSQDTGNNNQTSSGKLANGQPITVENVSALMEQLKTEYPNGTAYLNNFCTTSYAGDVKTLLHQWKNTNGTNTSLTQGCGGFARAISDGIFGTTGFPARRVTDASKVRPGDIMVTFSDKTHTTLSHVSIVYKVENRNGSFYYSGCDNSSSSGVEWRTTCSANAATMANGTGYSLVYTRYPD